MRGREDNGEEASMEGTGRRWVEGVREHENREDREEREGLG